MALAGSSTISSKAGAVVEDPQGWQGRGTGSETGFSEGGATYSLSLADV